MMARVLGAVHSVKGDHIVELWGDNPLIDPKLIDQTTSLYLNSDFDCVGNCLDTEISLGDECVGIPDEDSGRYRSF